MSWPPPTNTSWATQRARAAAATGRRQIGRTRSIARGRGGPTAAQQIAATTNCRADAAKSRVARAAKSSSREAEKTPWPMRHAAKPKSSGRRPPPPSNKKPRPDGMPSSSRTLSGGKPSARRDAVENEAAALKLRQGQGAIASEQQAAAEELALLKARRRKTVGPGQRAGRATGEQERTRVQRRRIAEQLKGERESSSRQWMTGWR